MRTDSVNLSQKFLGEAQAYIKSAFGERYATGPRAFQTKSKLAQEAHEAIRPTDVGRTPESIKAHLDANQFKLYDLVWRRAVASQLPPAEINATGVDIITSNKTYTFRATGSSITFDGYLKVYPESINETILPKLAADETVTAQSLTPNQHFTIPPARYSEAGLVKTLEAYGIGRPSTYAPTIATVIDRGYVIKEERRLKPTELAMLVNDVLVEHFPVIVDYKFTAQMEAELDAIASGEKEWSPVIGEFYSPFKENLERKHVEVSKKDLTEQATEEICDKCGKPMIIKLGRFGKFLACTGYPDCKNTKPLNGDGTKAAEPEPTNEVCDKCGKPMVRKHGRYGPFLGCSGYPECKGIKRIENKTGVACPECQQGELVERRSKFGRSFYSCNRYPDCKFALWSKPTGEKCPDCGSLIVLAKEGKTRCSKKDCGWESEAKSD
ncbi:MAG: topoisomerase protein [Candidatus Giovannonibacteria bacterium GW2011_GWA2_53_7]|uniref:Topoisomerase protein n=1 Tax=Candidatus Giovannonibacteria bacterium GW2011_GWA2_53_7 TaxID=1618650 RepID=A0A0G2ARD2_9BACT|nr:MAG: topoisomerase protein [Candidatus Giovannonibacteria bacterium GW2011_GWA2_53_7]